MFKQRVLYLYFDICQFVTVSLLVRDKQIVHIFFRSRFRFSVEYFFRIPPSTVYKLFVPLKNTELFFVSPEYLTHPTHPRPSRLYFMTCHLLQI